MRAGVGRVNELLQTIAQLNTQIASTEGVGSPANPLRDQRDQAIELLSELIDVTVIDRGMGGVDLLVGSLPVLQGGRIRPLSLQQHESADGSRISLAAGTPPETITPTSGRLGSLLQERTSTADKTSAQLDTLASSLIFEINRIHSTSSNAAGLTSASSGMPIRVADRALAFSDGANQTFASLPFRPVSGGFEVTVTHGPTGATRTVRIPVDLDGVNNAGTPGFGDDTSPESLRASLDAVDGISAQFGTDGRLRITAAEGYNFRFDSDSSGILAVMGVNAYFSGTTPPTSALMMASSVNPPTLPRGESSTASTSRTPAQWASPRSPPAACPPWAGEPCRVPGRKPFRPSAARPPAPEAPRTQRPSSEKASRCSVHPSAG